MQIYTRTGDHGTTRIIGGQSLFKDDIRMHALGGLDELNSLVGICLCQQDTWDTLQTDLYTIQHYLFDCGNDVATPANKQAYKLEQSAVKWLEDRIDSYASLPPETEYFILPGGSALASHLHYLRTVTRRVERDCVHFARHNDTNPIVLKFINRLSDYCFAAARLANYRLQVVDIPYTATGKVFHPELNKNHLPDKKDEE